MRILLALFLMLALAGPADAILVEGTINTSSGNDFAPFMDLRGEEGFSVRTGPAGDAFPSPFLPTAFLNQPYDGLSRTSSIRSLGIVTYQGQTFVPTGPGPPNVTGPLTFGVEPFSFRPDPGIQPERFVGDSSFTMTGQLSFDGHTVALEGSGVLTAGARGSAPSPFLFIDQIAYNFTPIPEPGTLLLFGTAAGLGALYRLRKRRGVR